ncbi:MAG: MFS transporter, partial [Candidatus Phosphoribacter sp.]
ATSVAVLAAAVLAVGLAGSVFGLARHAYLTEAVVPHLRARALSTLGGVHRVGMFIGPFIGAVVLTRWGKPGAYAVGVLGALLAAVLVAMTGDLAARQAARQAARDARPPERTLRVGEVLRTHRRVLTTLGIGVLAVAATRSARNAIVPLWAEAIGLDAAATSLVFGISGAADMLLFYPAGWAMDRFGRVFVAVPSMLVLGCGMMLVPLAGSMWSLVAVATLLGVGNGIGSGILMTLGADASPVAGRAQFLGGWRLMGDVGWALGPAVVSAVVAVASLGAASVVMGLLAWAGAGWLRVWVPRYDPIRRGPADRQGRPEP